MCCNYRHPQSGVTQKRMGFLLNLIPFKVSSLCHRREFFLAMLNPGLLIRDLDLYPDFYKVLLWQYLLFAITRLEITLVLNFETETQSHLHVYGILFCHDVYNSNSLKCWSGFHSLGELFNAITPPLTNNHSDLFKVQRSDVCAALILNPCLHCDNHTQSVYDD